MSDSIFETVKDRESPLAEQAAEQISQLIIDRQLTNGEKLPNEFELAEQLNVGREAAGCPECAGDSPGPGYLCGPPDRRCA